MTLYDQWIDLKAEYLKIRECYGDTRLRAIAFDYKVNNQFLFIVPKCVVTKPPSRLIGLQVEQRSNITIEQSDYYVRSVPRDFPYEAFKKICYLDAMVSGGNLFGISCRVTYIDDSNSLSYDLILRKETEQNRF